jgi:hypothetical protein
VKRLQTQYLRNESIVDAEQLLAFPDPPRFDELDDEQQSVVRNCSALEADSVGVDAWAALESPSYVPQP